MRDFIFFCLSDPGRKLSAVELIIFDCAAMINVSSNNFVISQHDKELECVVSNCINYAEIRLADFSFYYYLVERNTGVR